ncbi:MAG: anion transporter, partial [Bacteroidetes bacterium]
MKATPAYSYPQLTGLLLGPLAFVLVLLVYQPAGLSPEGQAVLATTLWVAIWWITEAAPIEVTALLPGILFPLTGGLAVKETTQAYGHPLVFLFLGGFLIALAIERWNLHRRIALTIIARVGTSGPRLVMGFMLATAFLSMWISNTATSLMMMPIGLALIRQVTHTPTAQAAPATPFAKALMLGIAYSSSIGGMSTLIGTPPNLVFAAVVKDIFGVEISFARWFVFAFPFSVTLLMLCWWYLVKIAFRLQVREVSEGVEEIRAQLRQLGPLRSAERLVLAVFGLTALAWISRSFLLQRWIPMLDDTIIALSGAMLLFLLPVPGQPGMRVMDWRATARLPW